MKEVLGPCRSRRSTCSRDLYHLHARLASLPGYVAGVRCHEEDGALPTSIRFLFYELLDRGVIPKTYYKPDGTKGVRTPSQDIADTAKALREARLVPWSWIVDETRILHDWAYAGSVYQYVENTLPSARIDLWGGEPAPLILCESRSLAGVLRGTAATYLCPIAATNGQAGGFLHTEVAPLIAESGARRVLYLGDLDLSRGHIEENTRKVLSEYGDLSWEKVTITDVQVQERIFPVVHKKDKRFKPARELPAVETEALGQVRIRDILSTALAGLVPESLEQVLEREEHQRVQVRELLESVSGIV